MPLSAPTSHLEQHTATPARRGRLLLVTYSFPPDRRVGALRWQRLTPPLMERGWEVDVLTLAPEQLPAALRDRSPEAMPPEGVRVFGVPHPQPWVARWQSKLVQLARWLRRRQLLGPVGSPSVVADHVRLGFGRFFTVARAEYLAGVADASDRAWGREALKIGVPLVSRGEYAGIISSGPPHVAHVVASQLAASARIPHIVDLRDPWSTGRWLDESRHAWASWRAERDEQRTLAAARRIICNTAAMEASYAQLYPALRDKLVTIMNGSDEDPLPPTAHGDRFLIVFAGSIYIDRDPTPLFRAAARVVRELDLTPEQFGIELVGDVERFRGASVREIAAREGVSAYVTLTPPVPRARIAELFARAQVLVNLPQDSMTQIPAKTFEYVRAASWVLVFAPPGSATDVLLRDSGADVVGLDDADAAARALMLRYQQHSAGIRPQPLNADGRFSRSRQAARLVDMLETAIPARAPSARASESTAVAAAVQTETSVASPVDGPGAVHTPPVERLSTAARGLQWARRLGLTNAIAFGAIGSLVVRSLGVAAALGVQSLLARQLGQSSYGHYVYVLAWMNVVLLAVKLEYDTAGVRFVSEYTGTSQWAKLRGFVGKTQRLVILLGIAAALLVAAGLWAVGGRIDAELRRTGLWTCLLLIPTALLAVQGGMLQGFQRVVAAQAPTQLVRPVVFGLLMFVLVRFMPVTAEQAVIGNTIATVVALVCSAVWLRQAMPVPTRATAPDHEWKTWLRVSRGMLVISAAQLVLGTQADVLVVGTFLDNDSAALYSTASQVALLVVFGSTAVTTIAVPQVAELYAARRMGDLQRLLRLMAYGTLLVTLPILIVTLVAGKFLLSIFGEVYVAGYSVLVILSLAQAVVAVVGTMGGFLMTMTGHEHEAAVIFVGSAILNLVLTLVLTPIYGIAGTAAATLVATIARTLAFAVFAHRKLGLELVPFLPFRRLAAE